MGMESTPGFSGFFSSSCVLLKVHLKGLEIERDLRISSLSLTLTQDGLFPLPLHVMRGRLP